MNILRLAFVFVTTVATGIIQAAEKPNIILIYTDDHGWPDIGAAGIYEDLKTPHIDALAASGVRATHGYSTAPQCVPSRAGLLAGRSQNRFGVEGNGDSLEGFNAQLTIAERLKTAGYATGQIGKWHLGVNKDIPDHGFDDVYSKNANRPCFANFTLAGETIEMQTVDDRMYHLDACSEAALAFIERHHEKPFFLYLAYRAPHVPLDAPPKYLNRFPGKMPERRRQALAMISAMDDGVGKIVADLKKRNLYKNTLIFYIGDNGAPLKIHKHDAPGGGPGWDGSLNKPMNGEKGMLTEGGIRVPFVISWPGKIPGEQVYDHPVWTLDVAATAVELAGLGRDDKLDGVNLIPYLSGEVDGPPHRSIAWRWISQAAIREGEWKLLVGGDREYLYNLAADPGEQSNQIKQNPEVADRLRAGLNTWAGEMRPPGLATGKMAETWDRYFDFYLEGKPAPPLKVSSGETAESNIRGWIPRSVAIEKTPSGIKLSSDPGAKNPFITHSRLKLTDNFTALVTLKSTTGGKAGIAWRSKDQSDFVAGQITSVSVPPSPKFQTIEIPVPATGESIHLRLFIPHDSVIIEKIEVKDSKRTQQWNFRQGPPIEKMGRKSEIAPL